MSKPKDDDISQYDPFVQGLRRSQMDVLRKFLNNTIKENMNLLTCLTDIELLTFHTIVSMVNK